MRFVSHRKDGGQTVIGVTEGGASVVSPMVGDGCGTLLRPVAAASRSAVREEPRGEAAPADHRGGGHGRGFGGGASDSGEDIDITDVVDSGSDVRGVDGGGIVINAGGGNTGNDGGPAAGVGGGDTGNDSGAAAGAARGAGAGNDGGAAARVGEGRCLSRTIGDPAFVVPPQACSTFRKIALRCGIGGASPDRQRLWNPEPSMKPLETRRAPSMCQTCGHDLSCP